MASGMDQLGTNINAAGATMSRDEVERERHKKGQCVSCGQQCYEKKMFSRVPLTIHGLVLNGRCLACRPLNVPANSDAVLPPSVRVALPQAHDGGGGHAHNRGVSSRSLGNHSSRSLNSSHNGASGPDGCGGGPALYQAAVGGAAAERLRDKHRRRHPVPHAHGGRGVRRREEPRKPRSDSYIGGMSPNMHTRPHPHMRGVNERQASSPAEMNYAANSRRALRENSAGRIGRGRIRNNGVVSAREVEVEEGASPRAKLGSSRQISDRSVESECSHTESGAACVPDEDYEEAQQILQDMDNSDYISIFSLMKNHPDSPTIQIETCKAIANLELNHEDREGAAEMGGVNFLIECMKHHHKNATIQELGCRALWNLSSNEDNQDIIADAGGIDIIVNAMMAHEKDPNVQEKSIAALSNLAVSQSNQELIVKSKAIDRIVHVMGVHMINAAVQEMGCIAFTNLASRSAFLKTNIADAKGINALVVMMMVHQNSAPLQAKALRSLRNLCANDDVNKQRVAEEGGIEYVIRAMQDHRDDVCVQEQGCWTLSSIAVNANNKVIIGGLGGIDVIVRAMWVHIDSASVLEWACRALWTLSVDQGNKIKVIEVGGIEAVVNGMRAHQDVPAVQEKGCGVLANLAANSDSNKVKIVDQEGLDVVIMAMILHPNHRLVQDRACSALRKLVCTGTIATMKQSGVGQVLETAKEKFPKQCKDKANFILEMIA